MQVTDSHQGGKIHSVEALVLPRIASNILASPVLLCQSWKHLDGLNLADPDYGMPKAVDLLFGADIFSSVVLHGWQFRPSGSPLAFETQFRWVLAGSTGVSHHGSSSC